MAAESSQPPDNKISSSWCRLCTAAIHKLHHLSWRNANSALAHYLIPRPWIQSIASQTRFCLSERSEHIGWTRRASDMELLHRCLRDPGLFRLLLHSLRGLRRRLKVRDVSSHVHARSQRPTDKLESCVHERLVEVATAEGAGK